MNATTRKALVFLLLLTSMLLVRQATAQDVVETPDITVHIEGLACPICAYGLEKRLKKIETVEAISIHIKDGVVRIKLKEDATITEEKIRKAVSEAGFTVSEIEYREKIAGSDEHR